MVAAMCVGPGKRIRLSRLPTDPTNHEVLIMCKVLSIRCVAILALSLVVGASVCEAVNVNLPMESQSVYAKLYDSPDVFDVECGNDGIELLSHHLWNDEKIWRVIYSFDMSQIPANAVINDVMPRIWASNVASQQPCAMYGYVGTGSNSSACSECMTWQEAFDSSGCNIDGGDLRIFSDSEVTLGEYDIHNPLYDAWLPGDSDHQDILDKARAAHANANAGMGNHYVFIWFYILKIGTANDLTTNGYLYGAGATAPYAPYFEVDYDIQFSVDSATIDAFVPASSPIGGNVCTGGSVSGSGSGTVSYQWTGTTPTGSWTSPQLTATMTDGSGTIPQYCGFPTSDAGVHTFQVQLLSPSSISSGSRSYTVEAVAPTVTYLHDTPDPSVRPDGVELSALVSPGSYPLASVAFYFESNATAGLQIGTGGDELIGTDTAEPWEFHYATGGVPAGASQYYALATDTGGLTSALGTAALSETHTILNLAPVLGDLICGSQPLNPGDEHVFTLSSALDPDGSLAQVELFVDRNDDSAADPEESLGVDSSGGDGWNWQVVFTEPLPEGDVRFLAIATDNEGATGQSVGMMASSTPVGDGMELPKTTGLLGTYPNPFNPSTTIKYALAEQARVEISVFDVSGQRVKQLVARNLAPGAYETTWHGEDALGRSVPSGVYFARMFSGDKVSTLRMVLVK